MGKGFFMMLMERCMREGGKMGSEVDWEFVTTIKTLGTREIGGKVRKMALGWSCIKRRKYLLATLKMVLGMVLESSIAVQMILSFRGIGSMEPSMGWGKDQDPMAVRRKRNGCMENISMKRKKMKKRSGNDIYFFLVLRTHF
jgi:hypothetical protein